MASSVPYPSAMETWRLCAPPSPQQLVSLSGACQSSGGRRLRLQQSGPTGRQQPTVQAPGRLLLVRAGNSNGSALGVNGVARGRGGAQELVQGMDVAGACVEPVYRSFPRPKEEDRERREVHVLFLSEGNVCRSVVAEAVFRALVQAQGLQGRISCQSKAVRDYNVGEPPEPLAVQVAAQCGVAVDETCRARIFKPAEDIVDFDLLLVMDKFNAADVLKEVSVFDTIDPLARYSSKVRRLGDFCKSREIGDIDDPLYGNMGGAEELDNLSDAVTDIQEACQGLLDDLQGLSQTTLGEESLRKAVLLWLQQMENMDWLVPPMLQKRKGT